MSTRRPPAKRKKAAGRARAAPGKSRAYDEFLVRAHAMEEEAAQRYDELADQMEVHNNTEVAALFRKMAEIERKHAVRVLGTFPVAPGAAPPAGFAAPGPELSETIPAGEVHYLMSAWHALELALACEQRAERYFSRAARTTRDARVRAAARQLASEEKEHVRLIREWMQRVPRPDAGWDYDPDPPVYSE